MVYDNISEYFMKKISLFLGILDYVIFKKKKLLTLRLSLIRVTHYQSYDSYVFYIYCRDIQHFFRPRIVEAERHLLSFTIRLKKQNNNHIILKHADPETLILIEK